ncbi:hypothetical protein NDU88_005026 [Pleurodeles waltl]|uniref:Secreted protein n=1 Tax=Pleurodeles waltl TaxID=8319 RepID=A0AAV7RJW6_PLEWA|nr:hypothetical protein NDU88_005026 [Pleurodeles waltl]
MEQLFVPAALAAVANTETSAISAAEEPQRTPLIVAGIRAAPDEHTEAALSVPSDAHCPSPTGRSMGPIDTAALCGRGPRRPLQEQSRVPFVKPELQPAETFQL